MLWSFSSFEEVGGEQHDGRVAEILPPMRYVGGLGHDVARVMHQRHGAIARIFVDLAFDDVDDGGTVGVAVPGDDAARLDHELAHAEVPAIDVERRLAHVDRGDGGVGDADRLQVDGFARIRLLLIGGAFAGDGGNGKRGCACDDSGKKKAAAKS